MYSTAQNGSGVHARWIDGSVVIRAYIKRMGMGLNNMRESAAAPPFSCTHMTHLSRKRHALDHSAISSSTGDGTAASFAAATSRAIRAAEHGMYRASDSGLIHEIPRAVSWKHLVCVAGQVPRDLACDSKLFY